MYDQDRQRPVPNVSETSEALVSLPVWAFELPKYRQDAVRTWLDNSDETTVYRRVRDEGWLNAQKPGPESLHEEPAFPPPRTKPKLPEWANDLTPLKQELVLDELNVVEEGELHVRLKNLGWVD